ncbi:unnamed protein product [Hermetia illucens]|uniref:Proton-coupled folate transporter n=2 Tax=Hermetia illucens TaxID=343691 RepID=A0A7R8UJ71_HERIL|nr:unnamed protein product [Hermetia illucens]
MALYMFAFMITSVVEQAFFVYKTCRVNHNYTEEICVNINQANYTDIKKEVQITVSTFYQWNNIAAHVFPIFLAMFLGSWSDRRGRKFPLLMGLCGKLIYSIMIIVNATNHSWPIQYVLYTATIPCALTGADLAIFASCFAYVSDVSTVDKRTLRVAILEVCYLVTIPTGVALGSFLFNNVLNASYAYMFTVNASLLIVALIYSLIMLKWQTTEKQRSLREVGFFGFFPDFFDRTHVVESIRVLVKKREGYGRVFLFIFLGMMTLYTFQRDEKPFLYLYTQLKFHWGVTDYSYFKTFQSSAYCIVTLIGIPLMNRVLKWKDTVIIFIGSTAHGLARIVYLLAEVPPLFYFGSLISSVGPVTAPVIRSMVSKNVPITERGKMFALLSVCDNATPFISSVLYTQTYNATIGEFGGIFVLTLATQCGVFLLAIVIHMLSSGISTTSSLEEKRDALIEEATQEKRS